MALIDSIMWKNPWVSRWSNLGRSRNVAALPGGRGILWRTCHEAKGWLGSLKAGLLKRCNSKDEGRPLEVAFQKGTSNCPLLLRLQIRGGERVG